MRVFQIHAAEGRYHSTVAIASGRERLWAAAFGVEDLAGLFDMTGAEQAAPIIDTALARFVTDADTLRPFLSVDDPFGLFGNREALSNMRDRLVNTNGVISGAVDETMTL